MQFSPPIARVAASAADRQRAGILLALQAQVAQRLVCDLFGKGTEGSPFAADQRIDREAQIGPVAAQDFDTVIARNLTGRFGAGIWQRTNARELENDV